MQISKIILLSVLGLVHGLALNRIWHKQPYTGIQRILGGKDSSDGAGRVGSAPDTSFPSINIGHKRRPRTGFVAFGDSYSAGIGTGVDGAEDDCRQGLHAHPALIARDLSDSQGGAPNATAFQFLSCTGSTADEVLSGSAASQIDAFDARVPADFALLSVGGNDLGFFEVINACVFRFYNFYSGTCESALRRAQDRLDGREFEEKLQIVVQELLDKVHWEKKPWFFITVTGYARFFNDQTDDCDNASFGIWWRGPKLKKDLRVRMNALVQAVNQKIEETVARINARFTTDKMLFVNYDKEFEGHRFCEPGVQEPDYSRNDTWFFLVGGSDNARNETAASKKSLTTVPVSPSSSLIDPDLCLGPAQKSGDWGMLALCYMAMSRAEDPTLRPANGDIFDENSMWYVPTYYGKTFHPRTRGHEMIRDKIYQRWAELGL